MRTEDEIIAQVLTIKLAGKEYAVKPLNLTKAMAWRKEFGPKLSPVMSQAAESANSQDDFLTAFVGSPELVVDSVFSYAPEIAADRATIMENCTEQEIFVAFMQVMGVAFGPFLGQRVFMRQMQNQMDQEIARQLSEPSSRLH